MRPGVPKRVRLFGIIQVAALCLPIAAGASHQGHGDHRTSAGQEVRGIVHAVPGAPFPVIVTQVEAGSLDQAEADAVGRTLVEAFTLMLERRQEYPRFSESLAKGALEAVIVEPRVVNQEGKEFPFLVTRTQKPGRVRLLVNATSLQQQGYVGHPERLVPALAREFQWVVSKADTAPKPAIMTGERDLARAPIRSDAEIREMSGPQRIALLQRLFDTYLRTVDDHRSLWGQPYFEVGTTTPVAPAQPDSTIKLYDIRVREALQRIVGEPSFLEQTPKAVRSVLNGKIWTVCVVHIPERDWATRTRVVPEEKAVVVGERKTMVQPAAVLVNLTRRAAPDDPFYRETNGLPMGALSPEQLAAVIAREIEGNIIEKSMRGHVAQDEKTAPR